MNKFLLGMSLVGSVTNSFAGAMADGKGTVGEMVDVAADAATTGITLTGAGSRVIYDGTEGDVDINEVGSKVADAVRDAMADGRLTVADLPAFTAAITHAALSVVGVEDKVVVDGTA